MKRIVICFLILFILPILANSFKKTNLLQIVEASATFTLQVASTNDENVASEQVSSFISGGHFAYYVKAQIPGRGIWYRVRVGKFSSVANAQHYLRMLGSTGAFITTYDGPKDIIFSLFPEKKVKSPPLSNEESNNTVLPSLEKKSESVVDNQSKEIYINDIKKPKQKKISLRSPRRLPLYLIYSKKNTSLFSLPVMSIPRINGWIRQESPVNNDLVSLFFINSESGWIGGTKGVLLHTNDGGMHWTEQISKVKGTIQDIFFIDEKYGWAIVSRFIRKEENKLQNEQALIKTEDGGKSWEHVSEINATSVYFLDKSIGYAVGYNSILRTKNGGKDWKRCNSIGFPTAQTADQVSLIFTQVQFLNTKFGWALGNFYSDGLSKPGGIFSTSDGGQTWERCFLSLENLGELINFHFYDAKQGYLSAEFYEGDKRFVVVYITYNGGISWSKHKTAIPGYQLTKFTNTLNGWIIGPMLARNDGPPYEVSFLHTKNGGVTWDEEITAAGIKFYNMSFVSSDCGWIVGEGGTIFKYVNNSASEK